MTKSVIKYKCMYSYTICFSKILINYSFINNTSTRNGFNNVGV